MERMLLAAMGLNMLFSTVGDVCGKLWGTSGNNGWILAGMTSSVFSAFFFLVTIRYGGLATAANVLIVLTLLVNVGLGAWVFYEQVTPLQWFGLVLGGGSIVCLMLPSMAR